MSSRKNEYVGGLEALIVKWLLEYNGYKEGKNTDYSKEFDCQIE